MQLRSRPSGEHVHSPHTSLLTCQPHRSASERARVQAAAAPGATFQSRAPSCFSTALSTSSSVANVTRSENGFKFHAMPRRRRPHTDRETGCVCSDASASTRTRRDSFASRSIQSFSTDEGSYSAANSIGRKFLYNSRGLDVISLLVKYTCP